MKKDRLTLENEKLEEEVKKKFADLGNAPMGRAKVISARQATEYNMGKIDGHNYFHWQKAYNDELKKIL